MDEPLDGVTIERQRRLGMLVQKQTNGYGPSDPCPWRISELFDLCQQSKEGFEAGQASGVAVSKDGIGLHFAYEFVGGVLCGPIRLVVNYDYEHPDRNRRFPVFHRKESFRVFSASDIARWIMEQSQATTSENEAHERRWE
jgi:hypothetical protein